MTIKTELFEIKLHEIDNYKTPYIITLHCSSSFDKATENAFILIDTLLKANQISLENVSVYYYISSSQLDNLCEMSFDSYLDRYVGNRLTITPYESVPKCVQLIHMEMLKHIGE